LQLHKTLRTFGDFNFVGLRLLVYILNKIYTAWVILVFAVFMVVLLPGILLPFLLGQRFGWIGYRFLRLWSWIFSMLTFIHYKSYGLENFSSDESFIYISNHTSYLDIPGLCLTIPGEFRPLAKKELLKIPVFGWIAQTAAVIVDRSSGQSRKKSFELLKLVLKKGISILIFAEGTQNRSKELLQPFHDGAFRIAVDAQQPILPMVIIGAGKLMPPGKAYIEPGNIKIVVGKRIETENFTLDDIPVLKQRTFDAMKELILKNS
jgi:1-acyl-sn-glycerol-3-phosphate acyltransferase